MMTLNISQQSGTENFLSDQALHHLFFLPDIVEKAFQIIIQCIHAAFAKA